MGGLHHHWAELIDRALFFFFVSLFPLLLFTWQQFCVILFRSLFCSVLSSSFVVPRLFRRLLPSLWSVPPSLYPLSSTASLRPLLPERVKLRRLCLERVQEQKRVLAGLVHVLKVLRWRTGEDETLPLSSFSSSPARRH